MARITRVAPHLSAEELKTKLKLDPRPWCRQRWLIIYNALVDPREATDIAKHTGTTVTMVHQVVSSYNRLGIAAIETGGKGGRRRQYVTWEEQAFLASFFTRADHGEIATAGEIKHASARTGGARGPQKHDLALAPTAQLAQTHATSGPSASQCRSTRAV
jgi:hypothetical protein